MAVSAAAQETYDAFVIREDLTNADNMISPTETPFISMICGQGKATNTLHQWPKIALQAASGTNRVPEGEDAPAVSTPDYALKMANYTQISVKNVKVTSTSQWVDSAADTMTLAKQISYKLKELKNDREKMLLDNVPGVPGTGNGGATRQSAGLPAFIITNAVRGGGGLPPTLSGTTQGYPNAGATDGTLASLTEDMFRTVIQGVWNSGGVPKYSLVGPSIKTAISDNFTGTATRFKDADTKKLVLAVDIYESDFGTVQIVPDRFSRARDVFILDPEFCEYTVGQPVRQEPLAKTGLTENRLISTEYCLSIGNEAAMGVIADAQP